MPFSSSSGTMATFADGFAPIQREGCEFMRFMPVRARCLDCHGTSSGVRLINELLQRVEVLLRTGKELTEPLPSLYFLA